MGLKTVIFVPSRAPEGKLAQLLIFGAKVVSVLGDYKDTFDLSKAAIEKYGWYNRNAGINPILTEGKKTFRDCLNAFTEPTKPVPVKTEVQVWDWQS